MKPEQYFLKYSYPCAHVLVENGSIDEEKLAELREAVFNDESFDREELIKIFPAAFRRIKEVAKKMSKDMWNLEVIKKYFLEDHNMYIEAKDGGYKTAGSSFRNFCKVYRGEVIKKKGSVLTVKYGNETRNVLNNILPDAEVGDKVSIHQGFAIEKL